MPKSEDRLSKFLVHTLWLLGRGRAEGWKPAL